MHIISTHQGFRKDIRSAFPLDARAWRDHLALDDPDVTDSSYSGPAIHNDARFLPARPDEPAFLTAARLAFETRAPLALAPDHLWLLVQQACLAPDPAAAARKFDPPAPPSPPSTCCPIMPSWPTSTSDFDAGRALGGIPAVQLRGTLAEWTSLRANAVAMASAHCRGHYAWVAALRDALECCVDMVRHGGGPHEPLLSKQQQDQRAFFWSTLYTADGDGWVHVFFPFFADGHPNPRCRLWCDACALAAVPASQLRRLPPGCRRVVAKSLHDDHLSSVLDAGFLGVRLTPDGLVCPEIGWIDRTERADHPTPTPTPGAASAAENADTRTYLLTAERDASFNTVVLVGGMFPKQGWVLGRFKLPLGAYFNQSSCEDVVRSWWNKEEPRSKIVSVDYRGGNSQTSFQFALRYEENH